MRPDRAAAGWVASCLAIAACQPTMEPLEPPAADAARSALDRFVTESRAPGIQYLVVTADRTRFEYAGGWADIAGRRPMRPDTTLMAYSMSKTITAAAVLQLVGAGKIALDDRIDRYLDSQPYNPAITVRQLLSHTSGTPNPIPLGWVHPAVQHDDFDERLALARVLAAHGRTRAAPGARYAYSNVGYWLLGPIVERASGQAFVDYVIGHVLRPLGITPRELGYTIPEPAAHAKGYLEKYSWMNLLKGFLVDRSLIGAYEGSWLQIRDHYLNGPAFGGLIGTARAFGAFLQDQLRPHSRLFGDGTRAMFYETQRSATGAAVPMTLGWHVGTLAGVPHYYKEGGGGGFHCLMRIYPSRGMATVVMTNATGFDVGALLDGTDPLFLSITSRSGS